MKKTVQFFLLLFSVGILIAYQNCGQAPSSFGEWGSASVDDSDPFGDAGNFSLSLANTFTAEADESKIQFTGRCDLARSKQNRIEWRLSTGYSYRGQTSGTVFSPCSNQYYNLEIFVVKPSGDTDSTAFKFDGANTVYVDFIATDSKGKEYTRTYSSRSIAGKVRESELNKDCGSVSNDLCDVKSNGLALTSYGFGGIAIEGRARFLKTMNLKSERYPMFHIVDNSYKPYFGLTTGQYSNNADKFSRNELKIFGDKFGYTFQHQEIGKEQDPSDSSDQETWERYKWYNFYFYYYMRDWINPKSGALYNSYVLFMVCDSSNRFDCSVSQHGVEGAAYWPIEALGFNGIKLVTGKHGSLSGLSDYENWTGGNNFEFSNVKVRLCDTDKAYAPYANDRDCKF